jgi:hypothetical protein
VSGPAVVDVDVEEDLFGMADYSVWECAMATLN